jgi:hypothetical protein
MDAHNRRLEALVARLDAHVDGASGPGDPVWHATMERLAREVDALNAEGEPLLAEARHIHRRVRVAAWLALAGLVLIGAAKLWAMSAAVHPHH